MTYIMIGDESHPVDNSNQCERAAQALTEAGQKSAVVYVGEPDGAGDSYANGNILWASDSWGGE